MLVQTKKKLDIDMLLTALIGLLAGLLIQALLFSAEQREALALGRRAAENFAPQAAAVAESFLDREETALSEAQSRLRALTARKQKDYAAENRALLILVNPWNPMPADFVPQVGEVEDGYEMDLRAVEPLQEMMAACRAAGNDAYICSAFRTHAMQQSLFDNKVMRVMYEEGVPYEDAPEVAGKTVAVPGTSEHELGLATDIIDGGYPFWTRGRRRLPPRNGSWKTPGASASSCATPTARRISPASSTSPGITAMSAPGRRRSTGAASRWRNSSRCGRENDAREERAGIIWYISAGPFVQSKGPASVMRARPAGAGRTMRCRGGRPRPPGVGYATGLRFLLRRTVSFKNESMEQ